MKYAFALVMTAVAAGVQAQVDRITLPRGPVPDQTVHMRSTQDFTLELVSDGATVPPLQMAMKMIIAQTMAVGPRDERRRFRATMTVDDVTGEMTLNGAPMPMPAPNPMTRGQQFAIQYDESGAVEEVTGQTAGAATEMVKTILTNITKAMPSTSIAVGESIMVPVNMALPSLPTGPLGDMTGEGRMTLTSITMDGRDHIAHFDSVFTSKLTSSPQSPQPVKMEMQIKGSGAMEFNIERGLAVSTNQTGTLDGSISAGVEMKMHGTIKLTSQTTY